ncbi:hypothetical protein [Arcanobacterium haemolyticum]
MAPPTKLTLELIILDRSDAVIAALRSVSVEPGGWHAYTQFFRSSSILLLKLGRLICLHRRHAVHGWRLAPDVEDRWIKFDEFLAGMSLAIIEERYGLTRGMTVIDIPIGAESEYASHEIVDEPDDVEDQDSGEQ